MRDAPTPDLPARTRRRRIPEYPHGPDVASTFPLLAREAGEESLEAAHETGSDPPVLLEGPPEAPDLAPQGPPPAGRSRLGSGQWNPAIHRAPRANRSGSSRG